MLCWFGVGKLVWFSLSLVLDGYLLSFIIKIMPVDLQQFRGNFVEKISEMMAEKNHNSCYLMRETYVRIVNRLECLTYVEDAKKTCGHVQK